MQSDSQTDRVRNLVRTALIRHGASNEAQVVESFLIRDGHFCGRRFEADGLVAVWFAEESQVKFYDREGHIVGAANVDPRQRDAA